MGLGVGALLLFGVVGWSLVGNPEPEPEPLPVVAPKLPIATVAVETGALLIDAQPWGAIVQVVDGEGQEVDLGGPVFTPALLELEAGEYRVDLSRPELESTETCFVTVSGDATSSCELQLAVVDTTDFFKQTGWWQ